MATVTFEAAAAEEYLDLPVKIKARVAKIVERLQEWPDVSGAKPLRGKRKGRYRIRTGDYRLQFRVVKDDVIIERVGHRDGFYED
jgi:mRNA-degrading endonuclease RelE of RelBE toxin-antitoxin system